MLSIHYLFSLQFCTEYLNAITCTRNTRQGNLKTHHFLIKVAFVTWRKHCQYDVNTQTNQSIVQLIACKTIITLYFIDRQNTNTTCSLVLYCTRMMYVMSNDWHDDSGVIHDVDCMNYFLKNLKFMSPPPQNKKQKHLVDLIQRSAIHSVLWLVATSRSLSNRYNRYTC